MLWADEHRWAKLSFELSPKNEPTMVTVVTRGSSDDCNSITVHGDTVYLQIAKSGPAYVFYSSEDGKDWHILRALSSVMDQSRESDSKHSRRQARERR